MTTVSTTPRRISTSQAGEDRWVARAFASNAGTLYLALEMHGARIHPALSGSSDSNPVSIDLSQRLNRLVPNRPVVRINALDLSLARRRRSDIRAQLTSRKLDPDSFGIVVDVTVCIADDVREARRIAKALDARIGTPWCHGGLHYVGTPEGLGRLASDIYRADVADGVTVIPMWTMPISDLVVYQTVPWLMAQHPARDMETV